MGWFGAGDGSVLVFGWLECAAMVREDIWVVISDVGSFMCSILCHRKRFEIPVGCVLECSHNGIIINDLCETFVEDSRTTRRIDIHYVFNLVLVINCNILTIHIFLAILAENTAPMDEATSTAFDL